ncbi:DTW-like protein [Cynara cardunculus var. scolymus]|uniref:tRNA-uridine aminocarboxypropyltransferase n=1 Tax=Cynara cardunculus var. scolymus TaxID=59895 RepID=A0A103Y835_CYNCS|nr:DTW-like protein [Cynara cardunculus var. scolymus]
MFASATSFRAFTMIKCSKDPFLRTTTYMAAPPTTTVCSRALSADSSVDATPSTQDRGSYINEARPAIVSLQEWQAWGTDSPLPTQVAEIVDEMMVSERESDAQMKFGGLGGKLKGHFKMQEDKKHRAKYRALDDSEQKLHFFSARQIACRILGSRGYLCQKCWLPLEDCMCLRVVPCSLWHRIRFWLYMHPKDFLRQNNTGKLLWQTDSAETMNFILIDGTWSNSAAMFRRLKFSSLGLDKQAEAVEDSVDVLLASLTARRLRMGRSISRAEKHHDDIC